MAGRLEESCAYLNWRDIAGAVLTVYRENERNEMADETRKANSDQWGWTEMMREELFVRTRQHWGRRTGRHLTWFPYSVDGVVRLYMRFRKRNAEELKAFEAEINRGELRQ